MKRLSRLLCNRLRLLTFVIGATHLMVSMFVVGAEGQAIDERYAVLELEDSYSEPFSFLSGIRELSDGRILAADPTSQVLLRIDMTVGTADTLGREGAGPQEYDGPDRVFPLPGDSTLLVDLGNGRLIVIDPEGVFVEWTPMYPTTPSRFGPRRSFQPAFIDAAGNMYIAGPFDLLSMRDTVYFHKLDRATGEETRVVSLWNSETKRRPRGSKRPAFSLYDGFAVGREGQLAVVRANGYSIDWYFPDGRFVNGPPNEVVTSDNYSSSSATIRNRHR